MENKESVHSFEKNVRSRINQQVYSKYKSYIWALITITFILLGGSIYTIFFTNIPIQGYLIVAFFLILLPAGYLSKKIWHDTHNLSKAAIINNKNR